MKFLTLFLVLFCTCNAISINGTIYASLSAAISVASNGNFFFFSLSSQFPFSDCSSLLWLNKIFFIWLAMNQLLIFAFLFYALSTAFRCTVNSFLLLMIAFLSLFCRGYYFNWQRNAIRTKQHNDRYFQLHVNNNSRLVIKKKNNKSFISICVSSLNQDQAQLHQL